MLKKFIALFFLLISFATPFAAVHAADKPTVTVTTSFLADMVKEIAGDTVNIELIIPAGEDPHLYVAKASDADKLSSADLVLYHGLHFEGKMVEILESLGTSVTASFPEDKIGKMEEEGTNVVDPHFWFDIDLYKLATQAASDALIAKFPDHKEEYEKNTQKYLTSLDELKSWIQTKVDTLPAEKRILITPHDAFNYFAHAWKFEVVAPQGVSTDSEVSNQQIKETVEYMVEHKVPAIFAESTTNPERMVKLQEAAKALNWEVEVVSGENKELFSDSLAPSGHDGDTYVTMYQHNINLIIDHLTK